MTRIALDSGVSLEFELAAWEQPRVVGSLNRNEFVVLSLSGYWRASFDYRSDALDFAKEGDVIVSHTGAILSVVAAKPTR